MTYLGADGAAGGSDDVAYQAMVLTLTNVGVFVGVGGSLSDTTDGEANNTPNDYSDDEVNYDGGVGFYASLDSLTLVTLKDTNSTPQKSYLALDVSGVDAGFKGIDHLTLNVRDASIQVNQAKDSDATPPPKLDWTKFTNANTTGLRLPALAVDDKVDIKAAGNVAIDVDGFVQVFGSFAFSKLTNIEVTSVVSAGPSAGTPTQRTVNVMTFGLDNVNVFVGAGPYFQDADDDGVADTDVHGEHDRRRRRDRPGAPRRVARACAVQADRSRGAATTRSAPAQLGGPRRLRSPEFEPVSLTASGYRIEVNGGTDGTTAAAINFATQQGGKFTVQTGPGPNQSFDFDYASALTRVAIENAVLKIEDYVYISGGLAFTRQQGLDGAAQRHRRRSRGRCVRVRRRQRRSLRRQQPERRLLRRYERRSRSSTNRTTAPPAQPAWCSRTSTSAWS